MQTAEAVAAVFIRGAVVKGGADEAIVTFIVATKGTSNYLVELSLYKNGYHQACPLKPFSTLVAHSHNIRPTWIWKEGRRLELDPLLGSIQFLLMNAENEDTLFAITDGDVTFTTSLCQSGTAMASHLPSLPLLLLI